MGTMPGWNQQTQTSWSPWRLMNHWPTLISVNRHTWFWKQFQSALIYLSDSFNWRANQSYCNVYHLMYSYCNSLLFAGDDQRRNGKRLSNMFWPPQKRSDYTVATHIARSVQWHSRHMVNMQSAARMWRKLITSFLRSAWTGILRGYVRS